MIHPLWHRFPTVYQQLEQIQQRLEQVAVLREPQVHTLIQQQINAGGKMLRSGLMLMLARFGQPDNGDLVTAGAAIEALHLATLVHDDVLDHADIRRGMATVSAKSGNREAIYAGDFLFAIYFQLLSEQNPDVVDLSANARIMKRIFMGEVDQNGPSAPLIPTIDAYLSAIAGKTAALFALSTYTGAVIGRLSPEQKRAAYRFGRQLGMAFQMIDDLLDYTQTSSTLNKPALEDLHNGIVTLPLIYAYQIVPEQLAPLTQNATQIAVNADKIAAIVRTHGLSQAQQMAVTYTNRAVAALAPLPTSATKSALVRLTHQMLKRSH
ncbi:polyprenyl synthetase family protein [Lacticaseibacillus chiayiensis]|uniref:Polyprenyl synthetase family protein n=1 Tax=Lacticaseibacillus chiayiensis TaxID=2100821 RepID=A0ABY6H390_9LACO|nr:polyprenyl synthetase family protein [Lacticaseibacillus chiayiensis]QVI34040.1 polyprenyl synthetase family protein [Lacticaseibacillus chiayiensis]RXT59121.1 octaprenyl-diphosphate synthase [Lacticaseibacillus chiayiensis]UYN55816.1 polyprenyl synthetase family protein [Lacticaseibacillus chiayiensis]